MTILYYRWNNSDDNGLGFADSESMPTQISQTMIKVYIKS